MALEDTDLPVHPRTGLRAVGIVGGKPVWPILGAAEDAGDGDGGENGGDDDGGHADVSLEELQVSLAELGLTPGQIKGRLAASRRWEDRAKGKDPEFQANAAKAAKYDALLATTQTDQERAVETAKQEAKAAAQLEAAPRLVRAEFKAAAKGVLDDTQLAALLEDRDLTKYVTDSGDVDEARVAKIVTDAAPKGQQQQHVGLGQGRNRADVKPSVSKGRELYRETRGKQKA